MSFSIGIVGLPNVGKSTLFTALTKKEVEVANYPFATIDPNVGVVEVPDERLHKLSHISNSKNTTPTIIEFFDIAGLVKGASGGEGLGNNFLANIQEVDAILYVVRAFESESIQHVEKNVDPMRDINIIRQELALKDIDILDRRIGKLEGEARTGDKYAKKQLSIFKELLSVLNNDTHIYEHIKDKELNEDFKKTLKETHLLTAKPALYLFNSRNQRDVPKEVINFIENKGFYYVVFDVQKELEARELTEEEKKELDLESSGLDELIKTSYKTLSLITFFTTGEDETRAWTVKKGSTAPQAAGVIHSDFEEKFIRAEVVHYDELLRLGGWSKTRDAGKLRTEGKEYIVEDGDVVHILHGST